MKSDEIVERLAAVIHDGNDAAAERHARAVLAELAKMGAEDLPSEALVSATWWTSFLPACSGDARTEHCAPAVRALFVDHVAPIIAAKDAEIARLREENEAAHADASRVAREAREIHARLIAERTEVYEELMALRAENAALKSKIGDVT